MKKKLVFIGLALILVVGTTLTFATNSLAATVNITADSGQPVIAQSVGGAGGGGVANTVQLQYSTGSSAPFTQVSPTWSPSKKKAVTISAGEVYYVDCTGNAADVRVTIYLTNAGKLAKDYTYLNMKVNVRAGTSGTWSQATTVDDSTNATDYLTFDRGEISFILQGSTYYDVSIDGGNFTLQYMAVDPSTLPFAKFYVSADPITGF